MLTETPKSQDPRQNIRSPLVSIWETLRSIQFTLRLTHQEMADRLLLTLTQYERLNQAQSEIGIHHLVTFSEGLDIGIDPLVDGKIDFRALSMQRSGLPDTLPEKYLVGANSRRSTVLNILDWLEQNVGWEMRQHLLREFQVSEAAIAKSSEMINLRLSVDIGEWLMKYYGKPELLVEIGRNSAATLSASSIGKNLRESRNLVELSEKLFIEIVPIHVEKNFDWKIRSLDRNHLVIDGLPIKDLIPILGHKYLFNPTGNLIRRGFISSIPTYLGFAPSTVKCLKDLSEGDDRFQFELDFSNQPR